MTLFLLTMLFFFFAGIGLRQVSPGRRSLLIMATALLLAFLYYTLERFI